MMVMVTDVAVMVSLDRGTSCQNTCDSYQSENQDAFHE